LTKLVGPRRRPSCRAINTDVGFIHYYSGRYDRGDHSSTPCWRWILNSRQHTFEGSFAAGTWTARCRDRCLSARR
jgi:hypothetical protein